MKKCACLLLCLALLLALSLPALAADPASEAMIAYAGIVAKADTYDFDIASTWRLDNRSYQYAVADLADGNGVPTLLLCLNASGYDGVFQFVRLFRYDPNSGTILAPTDSVVGGTAGAGGFRAAEGH